MHKTSMEDLYRVDPTVLSGSNDDDHVGVIRVENYFPEFRSSSSAGANLVLQFDHGGGAGNDFHHAEINGSDMFDLIKTQIANHPRYPHLVSAYIDCQKVGAPPEMVSLLEEIGREKYPFINSCSSEMGADPELDQFMESYCEVLHRYKEELSKPFDEATAFLATIGSQLSNLCKGNMTNHSNIFDYASDELVGTSEEELSCGEIEATESTQESPGCRARDQDLKGMLLRRYSGYISNLKKDFLKKRKKSKLPKDARIILMEWWSNHSRWPYPTEEEKAKLSERTGVDQKQMNNWFINQRKRHWKPSEEMRFALVDGVSSSAGGGGGGGGGGPDTYFDNIGGDRV